MPSDAALRSLLGVLTVPAGDPTKPLVHSESQASRVTVQLGDLVIPTTG